jgi:sirohydrochlorin cobaltochelatase
VAHLRAQYPQVRFALGAYFGFEPEIFALLEQRVQDLLDQVPQAAMPCDGCKFREIAQELGHGHSHHDHGHAHHDHAVA